MATVQVDNTNIQQVLAEAEKGVMPDVPRETSPPPEATKEPKAEAKTEPGEDDGEEGDDGLTEKQRSEWTDAMKRTIAKKHARQKSAEEFATIQYNERQLATQRAEQLARENEELKARTAPPPPEPKQEPKREAFQTEAEYQDAVIDWKVDQKLQKARLDELHEREQTIARNASERITRALELVPDYAAKTEKADYIVPTAVGRLMMESDLFAELGYHFADHPEDLGRLAILPPEKLKVEFRKIESSIEPFGKPKAPNGSAPSQNGEKPSTNGSEPPAAPSKPRAPVITPLNTGSAVQVEKAEHEMSAQEALEAWQKRNGRNFSRRQRH